MTAFDRFDPFERRITNAIDEIAVARVPDYLNDVLQLTARSSQRPRWSFPERWFNVDTTFARPAFARNVPVRTLLMLALLLAVVAAILVVAGSRRHLPPPVGLAANGQLAYGIDGDIYIRDGIAGASRLLLSGPSNQGGVVSSPDGQLIAYDNVVAGVDHAWVAGIDGTNPHQILDVPFTGLTAQWSYDSRSMVLVTGNPDDMLTMQLWNAPADGSGAHEIKLAGMIPLEAVWDPTRPGVLLVRAIERSAWDVDMYYVDTNATAPILSKVDVRPGAMLYGPLWEFRGMAFSPDGQTIAYNSVEQEANGEHFWTRLMNRDGTNDRPLARPAGTPDLYSQAWSVFSPDGKWIALESWIASAKDGTTVNQLAVATVDGSSPTRLVGPVIQGHSIVKVWAPDGTRVLMHVDSIDDMYLVDPETGNYEKVPWKSDFPDWQRVAP